MKTSEIYGEDYRGASLRTHYALRMPTVRWPDLVKGGFGTMLLAPLGAQSGATTKQSGAEGAAQRFKNVLQRYCNRVGTDRYSTGR